MIEQELRSAMWFSLHRSGPDVAPESLLEDSTQYAIMHDYSGLVEEGEIPIPPPPLPGLPPALSHVIFPYAR
jgi:hypothetical protein